MSAFGRMHKATAIVPLAVLSAAWTASLVGVGAGTASAEGDGSGVLPDGTSIPTEAVEVPASVGEPVVRSASVDEVSATGIPEAALAAYQRAEAVINKADRGCNITWQLIAAIGRAEFVTADMVKPGVVVIDVGINRVADPSKKTGYRLTGDVHFPSVAPLASKITPVPGGVGPMTVAMLMKNTVKAYKITQMR